MLTTKRPVEVSAAIFASPALRKVSFTGSTSVGATLLRSAAPGIVSSSMELGGNAPLIDARAVAKVTAMVSEAVTFGARVVFRGEVPGGPGHYYPPTVLTGVRRDCALYRGEIFGPIATVTPFDSEDEAVALANDTDAGLAGYVFSTDLSRAMRVGARLDFGIVGINRGFVSSAAAPFGGVKTSGLGREGGLHGLDEYLETQYLSLPVR